jgi:hypothetical protein
MAIEVRYTGEVEGNFSFGGDFVVICDHCGKIVDQETPGNIEFPVGERGDFKKVYFLHKECSQLFRETRGLVGDDRMVWCDLKAVTIETK